MGDNVHTGVCGDGARHGFYKHRVKNGFVRNKVAVLKRVLYLLFGIGNDGNLGNLASGAACGGNGDKFGIEVVVDFVREFLHRFGEVDGGAAAHRHKAVGHLLQRGLYAQNDSVHGRIRHDVVKNLIGNSVLVKAVGNVFDNSALHGKGVGDNHGVFAFFLKQVVKGAFAEKYFGFKFKILHFVLR